MKVREAKMQKFPLEAKKIFRDEGEYDDYELIGYYRLVKAVCARTGGRQYEEFWIRDIREALKTLDDRQYKILRLRYWDWYTLASVGNILSVTRQRIRQLENKALYKLKRLIKNKKWSNCDTSIKVLVLGTRGYNALHSAGIDTIGQLAELSKKDLMNIDGIGKNTYEDITHKLEAFVLGYEVYGKKHFETMPIESLCLNLRVNNALKRSGIFTIKKLFEMSTEELRSIRWIGEKGIDEVLKKKKEIVDKYKE